MDLFDRLEATPPPPLAERMRPRTLDEVVGQPHLSAPDSPVRQVAERGRLPSMVLWGPPGTGKTTLARLLAEASGARFVPFSAVASGVPELRKLLTEAEAQRRLGRRTVLFVDEIHRFHRGQQDVLLPHVERGTVTLLGATTENPSFALTSALLSRARVERLAPLEARQLSRLLRRALDDPERGVAGLGVTADDEVLAGISERAGGDARRALGILELLVEEAAAAGRETLTLEDVSRVEHAPLQHDRAGDAHYDVASAFIKSLRGSDPDAALYWMMRLLEAGDDPRFVSRRLLIFASEDVANADPRGLLLAAAADHALERLGMPEAIWALAQACTYLAVAPKSDATGRAWKAARQDVRRHGSLPVPMHLRNAPTAATKAWGHGAGYRNPHQEGGFAPGVDYLPDALRGRRYYAPKPEAGFERRMAERLEWLRALNTAARRAGHEEGDAEATGREEGTS